MQTFRLITENTIDHRIVERAKIKERLDRLVILHGQKVTKDDTISNLIAGIKSDMEQALVNDANKVDYNLEKILKESAVKEAIEEERIQNMTFEDAIAKSVYLFEGSDYRSIRTSEPSQSI